MNDDWNKYQSMKLSTLHRFCYKNNITIKRKYLDGGIVNYYFYDEENSTNIRVYSSFDVLDDPMKVMKELKEAFKR